MKRSPLMAATLLATYPVLCGTADAQPVTGIYIGGAGGANFLQQERIKSVLAGGVTIPSQVRAGFQTGVVGLGSLGYGLGNGVRLELEGNYRTNRPDSFQRAAPGIRSVGGREQKYGAMANVLFDLDVRSPYVFPYIGAGAGYAWVERRVRVANASGGLTTEPGSDNSFAYQAIAGLSFPIPPVVGLSLTAEYRYHALTGEREFDRTASAVGAVSTGKVRTTENYNHSLLLGLHYAFNVAPPPSPASPVPTATPVQQNASSYLVFFTWDRADLTDRAREVVAEAAKATARVPVTQIEVAGHADRSGPDGYNMRLSLRRAQAVKAELVRLGVPQGSIATRGFGERNPAIRTADGVREPQNRRVEIVLR